MSVGVIVEHEGVLSSNIRAAEPSAIEEAASLIRRGELVAFPTETVYGLGADAFNARAVARIFSVKGRPQFDPLIVHVASREQARALWVSCPEMSRRLIEAFWPGPLTLVLPKTERVPDLVTAGLSTVAVRMPDHPVALRLIERAGCPIAAPSANRFGRPSPTTAQAVHDELGDAVARILDAGTARIGIESTVVACEGEVPVLLRHGGVPLETLESVVGRMAVGAALADRDHPAASPGLLARHYAPSTPLYLLDDPQALETVEEAALRPIGVLSLTPVSPRARFAQIEVLSPTGDLVEAASRFFQALRRLDGLGLHAILALPIPERALGRALMDRLRRAATGRARVDKGRLQLSKPTDD